ncbi:hypothetical protein AOL_s00054g136 [Orbilia oligospora ATCC 24927]|uniref:HD/PDEase domain-containing protein n=2 Tax=Orbilia oligospora TaxID=2813651 RepID=G1X5J2_ARTOA|nr:hypothetical protein AOL_s00054g136 [Orbilia oligospora ATCC 24927]EGX51437.1 hypothetical protein AOL_s00054g136 [Orbilia oligospora ATCC 24927]KAF3281565.1 hypothetical protein TWF970_002122 [Orbilia oligospora]
MSTKSTESSTAAGELSQSDQALLPTLIPKTHAFVKDYMARYDSSHDFSHVLRVLNLAHHIAQTEQKYLQSVALVPPPATKVAPLYDSTIITLAALLHDVGDRKYIQEGEKVDESPVKTFLVEAGASEALGERVQTIVNGVSYSKEIKNPQRVLDLIESYPELAVVQDADRLDAIGAVGIGRTFTFAGAKGSGGAGMENVLKHFEEKLLILKTMMKTKTGTEMAEKRTNILRDFERFWVEEKSIAGGVELSLDI